MADFMAKKNYDLTEITGLLLKMRENCVPKDGDAYEDQDRAKKYDALNAAIDLINNPSLFTQWISVKDRLPEMNGDYLIHYRFKKQVKGKGFYSVCFYERTCERPHFHNEGYCGMYVTHWMPLPKAPEKGEQDASVI